MSVSGTQRENRHPHVYERIEIVHELDGSDLDTAAVHQAIELSATRYCTANAMFSVGPAEVHHRYSIDRGEGRATETGEVVVTGPGDDPDQLGRRWLDEAERLAQEEVTGPVASATASCRSGSPCRPRAADSIAAFSIGLSVGSVS